MPTCQPRAYTCITLEEIPIEGRGGTRITLRWTCAAMSAQDRSWFRALDEAEDILTRLDAYMETEARTNRRGKWRAEGAALLRRMSAIRFRPPRGQPL
jgi:hypothetical protein